MRQLQRQRHQQRHITIESCFNERHHKTKINEDDFYLSMNYFLHQHRYQNKQRLRQRVQLQRRPQKKIKEKPKRKRQRIDMACVIK